MSDFEMRVADPPKQKKNGGRKPVLPQILAFAEGAKGEWCAVREYHGKRNSVYVSLKKWKSLAPDFEFTVCAETNGEVKCWILYCRHIGAKGTS